VEEKGVSRGETNGEWFNNQWPVIGNYFSSPQGEGKSCGSSGGKSGRLIEWAVPPVDGLRCCLLGEEGESGKITENLALHLRGGSDRQGESRCKKKIRKRVDPETVGKGQYSNNHPEKGRNVGGRGNLRKESIMLLILVNQGEKASTPVPHAQGFRVKWEGRGNPYQQVGN